MSEATNIPRVCVVGPLVGRNPGMSMAPGELLAEKLAGDGFSVFAVSEHLNPYRRLADVVGTILRRRADFEAMIVEVYGLRSFLIEDAASLLGRRLGKRVVMVLHGGLLPRFAARFPRWTRRVLRRADVLVAPSRYLARTFEAMGFRVEVIPNMLDLGKYPHRQRRRLAPRLFWMRSFYPYYNPMMAVRVLARLRERYPDASLVLAGNDKGIEADVRQQVERRGLGDAVTFPGFLDEAAKIRAFDAADVYLNTNRVDNMPVSILEAGAMGLPVVATAIGGIPDLIDDEANGLLVPDDDDASMAEAVTRLIKDEALAARLSAAGRRLAETASWPAVRPRWRAVLGLAATAPEAEHAISST